MKFQPSDKWQIWLNADFGFENESFKTSGKSGVLYYVKLAVA